MMGEIEVRILQNQIEIMEKLNYLLSKRANLIGQDAHVDQMRDDLVPGVQGKSRNDRCQTMTRECPKCGVPMDYTEDEPDVGINGGWSCEKCGETLTTDDDEGDWNE